jgi:hypothetical protein
VRFRSKRAQQQESVLPERVAGADTTSAISEGDRETSTAQLLLLSLFREGLWAEASHLCQAALPHLPEYTQGRLRADVLPKLPPGPS